MAKNYDELTDFTQGSDTGDDLLDAIQPITNGEGLVDNTDRRPSENLRKRFERARARLDELLYYSDYDRALLFRSDLGFEFQQVSSGGTAYRLNGFGSGDLWIYPALTPGRQSGGRFKGGRVFSTQGGNWLPYAGTALVNDLILTCNSDFVGQRAYADGNTFDSPSTALTLGANGIKVQLVANSGLSGGIGSITAVWSGLPKRKVVITYGTSSPATQLADVINFINSDLTSATTYGLANFFRATTTGSLSNPPPTISDGVVQGQYDSEAFQITLAQLTAFFDITANQLAEGESLAVGFPAGPVELGAGAKGGRRQSVWDLPTNRLGGKTQNTAPSVTTNLFNTAREPEKIPGSIPVGKMINGRFVFADGTVVIAKTFGVGSPGDAAIKLGESADSVARYSSHSSHSTSGAFFIGYAASVGVQWANTDPFNPPTVADAIDQIVQDLASITSNHSGADHIGGDAMTGTASTGNIAKSVAAGTVGAQLLDMLNASGSPTVGPGINARVSEFGHNLHGKKALIKDFRETSPVNLTTGGGQLTKAIYPASAVESIADGTTWHDGTVHLEPLLIRYSGSDALIENTPISAGSDPGAVTVSGLSGAQFLFVFQRIPVPPLTHSSKAEHGIIVELKGVTGTPPNGDGFYFYLGCDSGTQQVFLSLIDNASAAPDFTGAVFTSATITFYKTTIVGKSISGTQLRAFLYTHKDEPSGKLFMRGRDGANAVEVNNYLEVYRSARNVGDFAPRVGRFGTDGFSVYELDATTDALVVERKSTNILATGDKALLDGVETSVTTDASTSHHHGQIYTTYLDTAGTPANIAGFSVSTSWNALSTNLSSPTEIQIAGPLLANMEPISMGINFRLYMQAAAAGRAEVVLMLGWRVAPSTQYNVGRLRFETFSDGTVLLHPEQTWTTTVYATTTGPDRFGTITLAKESTTNVLFVTTTLEINPHFMEWANNT